VKILLASQSPRRKTLLQNAGLAFEVHATDIDERVRRGERPRAFVKRLATEKAAAAPAAECVIAADTTVAIGAKILNKPVDASDAARMLRALSGKVHEVHTGVCVKRGHESRSFVVTTQVKFRKLSRADIDRYIASGECFDKAGAYAIQGIGAGLVDWLRGSYTNVIGLPVDETLAALR
jgi:septum formation protein